MNKYVICFEAKDKTTNDKFKVYISKDYNDSIDELSKIPIHTITADILSAKTFDSIYEAYGIYRTHYIDLMVNDAYTPYNFDYDINKPIIEQYEVVTVPKQYLNELIVNKKEK